MAGFDVHFGGAGFAVYILIFHLLNLSPKYHANTFELRGP